MNELENQTSNLPTKETLLKKVFGYTEFRGGQGELIEEMLSGRDVFAVMPTGAGKSICYQIPALMLSGITIVVSPLVSLMKDQVSALVQAGVPAAFLNNSLNDRQKELMLERAWQGRYKIIYVAPERLLQPRFLQFAQAKEISMVTVDEAHCISQWGQDFRPSYLKIKEFVEALPNRPIVSAFTATATEKVRKDIITELALEGPYSITTSFDRPNLYFEVLPNITSEKPYALLDLLAKERGNAGIIYCSTVKQVDETTELLQRMRYPATRYHAKLEADERRQNQDDFICDRTPIMVATNAFGMGIDKPNVRFVIHYNMPKDLESYYQEAGRAGRDGEAARCTLLYAASDVRTARYFIELEQNAENDIPLAEKMAAAQKAEERLKWMVFYSTTKYCLRQSILRYFGEKNPPQCEHCGGCKKIRLAASAPSKTTSFGHWKADGVQEKPSLSVPKPAPRKAAQKAAREDGIVLTTQESNLLAALFSLRKRLASKQKIPAYMVFSDATLREICQKKPVSVEELLNVKGVGETKAKHYGKDIIALVGGALE